MPMSSGRSQMLGDVQTRALIEELAARLHPCDSREMYLGVHQMYSVASAVE